MEANGSCSSVREVVQMKLSTASSALSVSRNDGNAFLYEFLFFIDLFVLLHFMNFCLPSCSSNLLQKNFH